MNKVHWIFIVSIITAFGAAGAFIAVSEERYESTGIIMLKRAQMERSGHSTEDSRNRWVWVRDGLELKNELLSEEVLKRVAALAEKKSLPIQSPIDIAKLRKQVEVHYSGGDDNLFTIRLRHLVPATAKEIVEAYLEVFPTLAIERRLTALESSLESMEKSLLDKHLSPDQHSRKVEIIETIKSDVTFAKAERDQRIVIIQSASAPVIVWPKPIFIFVAFGCFGVFFAALITAYLKKMKKL
jgi:uncharacterized protein involved in exopolysaccharide biosynthesis